jgi:hypothetical protein
MKTLAASLALPSMFAIVGCIDAPAPTPDEGGHLAKYASDPYGPAPSFRPSSCGEIAAFVGGATDGEYTLYIHNEPTYRWKVYCADMAGTPREYLSLANRGDGFNTSMFASAHGNVVTEYQKLRVDPETLVVDIGDRTFATSTGSAAHDGKTITAMPFGVAMGCDATATANINTRGTPFRIEGSLRDQGTNVDAVSNLPQDRQAFDVTVGGDCGWVAPTTTADPTSTKSQYVLSLAFFLPAR